MAPAVDHADDPTQRPPRRRRRRNDPCGRSSISPGRAPTPATAAVRPPKPAPVLLPPRRHRRGRRRGLTALPPPRRPRTVPEASGQLPARIRLGSPPVALADRTARRHRRGRRPGPPALPPPRRPRIVPEASGQLPGRIRPPFPPVALAQRKAPRHRRGRRRGLTALPPPKRPRIVLESFSNRPRRIRPASRKDLARPPPGRARPAHGSAPSPGPPAWSHGASAAKTPSNRSRIVLESFSNRLRKDPATVPTGRSRPSPGSAPSRGPPAWPDGASATRRPSNPPRIVLESSSNRSRTVYGRIRPASPPGALAPRAAPCHRGGRRPGLTALPPPGAPRTHLESSSNRPRRIRPASRKDPATVPTGRAGRGRAADGRLPAARPPNQPPPTRRSPTSFWCAGLSNRVRLSGLGEPGG